MTGLARAGNHGEREQALKERRVVLIAQGRELGDTLKRQAFNEPCDQTDFLASEPVALLALFDYNGFLAFLVAFCILLQFGKPSFHVQDSSVIHVALQCTANPRDVVQYRRLLVGNALE